MAAGTIGYHPGYFRAMSDAVTITVYGRGGHAAMPHNTIDPVVLAARIVLSLQTIVARENNPVDPVVVTIGSIHGGTQGNIISDEVRLQLSVRTYTPEVRTRTLAAIRRIAKGEALAAGAPREPQVDAPASAGAPVYNDPALTMRLASALKKGLGETEVVEMPQKMTSEDFAQYGLAGVPSVLLHIGAVDPAKLAAARDTGIPVPAPHSPEWAPEREPTLKGAIQAEVTALRCGLNDFASALVLRADRGRWPPIFRITLPWLVACAARARLDRDGREDRAPRRRARLGPHLKVAGRALANAGRLPEPPRLGTNQ
jgi:hippurate hydrolase